MLGQATTPVQVSIMRPHHFPGKLNAIVTRRQSDELYVKMVLITGDLFTGALRAWRNPANSFNGTMRTLKTIRIITRSVTEVKGKEGIIKTVDRSRRLVVLGNAVSVERKGIRERLVLRMQWIEDKQKV